MQTTPRTTPPPLGPVLDPNAPPWPKIIGIFAVAIGTLSFLFGLMRLWGAQTHRAQMENIAAKGSVDAETVNAYLNEAIPLHFASGIILAVVALLLLSGGIMLLKHLKISSLLIQVWAIAYLVAGVVIAYKNFLLVPQQVSIAMAPVVAENSGEEVAMEFAAKGGEIAGKFGIFVSLTWVLISSIFALIWFNRKKIRDEVRGWD